MALRERGDGGRREAGKKLAGWVRTELFRLLTKDQTRTNLTKADDVGENSAMGVLYTATRNPAIPRPNALVVSAVGESVCMRGHVGQPI